ncbi:MAG: ribonuclease P protein component [Clostridia bacterium]|nr:ribonuclease P protein component [Clostridia bacterium]
MLKKEYRLKKKYQFNYTFKNGQSAGSKHLVIVFTPSNNKNIKIGLAVTKKVGKAFMRNKIKRQIRSAIAPMLSNLKPKYNLIIVARPNIVNTPYKEIESEINYLIKKANLSNEKSN